MNNSFVRNKVYSKIFVDFHQSGFPQQFHNAGFLFTRCLSSGFNLLLVCTVLIQYHVLHPYLKKAKIRIIHVFLFSLDFKGVIDYIFSTPQSLARLGVLGPFDMQWIQQNKIIGKFPQLSLSSSFSFPSTIPCRVPAPSCSFGSHSNYGTVCHYPRVPSTPKCEAAIEFVFTISWSVRESWIWTTGVGIGFLAWNTFDLE